MTSALAAVPDLEPGLLALCRDRDPDAWHQLVQRFERLVYSVALRNGLPPEDAADVTQTTFLELWTSLDRIRDDAAIAGWLSQVARRQAWRVRNAARRHVPLDAIEEESVDQTPSVVDRAALDAAIQALGEHDRRLIGHLFFDPEEPSYADIADQLGRRPGGIGPWRGRVLDRMREHVS